MAQHYLIPPSLTKRFPALTKLVWRIEALLLRAIFQLLRSLPMPLASKISGGLFKLLGVYSSKAKNARRNLQLIFPDKSTQQIKQLSQQVFYSLGLALTELIHMPTVWQQRAQRLEFDVDANSEVFLNAGKAIVFIVSHNGAWQYTPFLAAQYNFPASIIYSPESNPYMREVFLKLRAAFPTQLVSSEGGIRVLSRELKKGNSMGLAADTRLDGGEMLPFFTIDAATNTIPARLALRNNCPIIPVRVKRLENFRYRVIVEAPITASDPEAAIGDQAIDITTQMNRIYERWITEAPGEWISLKRRWPKEAYRK